MMTPEERAVTRAEVAELRDRLEYARAHAQEWQQMANERLEHTRTLEQYIVKLEAVAEAARAVVVKCPADLRAVIALENAVAALDAEPKED